MQRVHNKHHNATPIHAVNIMRRSRWANPYKIGEHGDRDAVCDMFERDILPALDCRELDGFALECCCFPKRCHGDSIIKKLEGVFVVDDRKVWEFSDLPHFVEVLMNGVKDHLPEAQRIAINAPEGNRMDCGAYDVKINNPSTGREQMVTISYAMTHRPNPQLAIAFDGSVVPDGELNLYGYGGWRRVLDIKFREPKFRMVRNTFAMMQGEIIKGILQ